MNRRSFFGDSSIARRWNVTSWPDSFVLDGEGVIRYRVVHREELDAAVETLVAELEAKGRLPDG